MRLHTITRREFIDAVEHGIASDERNNNMLTDPERLMLRHVARTANETARGTFGSYMTPDGHMCGCPLTTAGITSASMANRALGGFWGAFDAYTEKLIGCNDTYIQIVG